METADKDRVIYERTAADLIYLVSCAVNKLIPDSDIVEKIDLDILYELAYKQSLLSAAAYALESAGKAAERFSTAVLNVKSLRTSSTIFMSKSLRLCSRCTPR